MCGIAGILNARGTPVDLVHVKAMTDAIAHRGPDGEGQFVDGPLGLGHRRLAILDLSPAGHQPMANGDGRYTISYNGELYNFRELRTELEQLGHQFTSSSDTEVVLKSYIAWGNDCLNRFNGMFAFAIWDTVERQLFLARDRYGIKPLYWGRTGDIFCFASEVKAILAHPKFSARLDKEALLEYFTFQNLLGERTLFAGVSLLPAGHWMSVSAGQTINLAGPTQYWDFDFTEPISPEDPREYLDELDRLFRQAVSRQLVSDVEIGSFLSGGIDSGAITALAASQFPSLKTFTCGFDLTSASGLEIAFDERRRAEMLSHQYQTEHYEVVLKSGDMERAIPRLTYHLETPRVGQSYPNYYVAKLTSKFVKVVLAGTGGDELFGGYPWRYYRAVTSSNFSTYIDKYYNYWQRLVNNQNLQKMFRPIHLDIRDVWTRDLFSNVFPATLNGTQSPEEHVNRSLYFEAKTFLHGLLVVDDKLSMAHSLETRVPFLDNDLVEFAMRLPVGLKLARLDEVRRIDENEPGKLHKYFQNTRDGKLLLRQMLSRYVPDEIASGVKQGFTACAPDANWFKGASLNYVQQAILDKNARIYEYLDRETVTALVQQHLDGKQNRRLLLWSLLTFEQFCHTFLP